MSSQAWQLVKDTLGTVHLVPAGTSVPNVAQAVSIPAESDAHQIVDFTHALENLHLPTAQNNVLFNKAWQDGHLSLMSATKSAVYNPDADPATAVTDIGIGALGAGVNGAIGDIADVADPFVPGQTARNAPDPGADPAGAGGKTGAKAGAGGLAAKLGLAGLLGATGWAELAVRVLEGLAGAALILLGLQALTGGSGNPVEQVKAAAGKVAIR